PVVHLVFPYRGDTAVLCPAMGLPEYFRRPSEPGKGGDDRDPIPHRCEPFKRNAEARRFSPAAARHYPMDRDLGRIPVGGNALLVIELPTSVRPRDDLHIVAIRIGEIKASAAVILVDLAFAAPRGVGEIVDAPVFNSFKYLIKLRFAD